MSDNIEARASAIGWAPKEKFRGDPEKWVDAATYLERGEQFLPILRADKRQLESEVATLKANLAEAQDTIKASQEAITELKNFHSESTRKQVEKAKRELRAELMEARQANDIPRQMELEEELDNVNEALRAAPPPPPAPTPAPAPAAPQIDPEFVEWQKDNKWFMQDRRLTALVIAEAEELRADPANKNLVGRAFYEEAHRRADAILNPRNTPSKVEQGTPSQSGRQGDAQAKTYKDLPPEAKAACANMAERLVGKGRAFAKLEEFQAHYAAEFFAGE